MRVRALDINGDWTFGKGQNDYLTGNAAIAQAIKTRLLSFLGNCFFDLGGGIDWFTFLGGKDQTALNLAISTVILNTSDASENQVVTGIQQLSVVLSSVTRKISIQYRVQTVYSVLTGNFEFDLNGSV